MPKVYPNIDLELHQRLVDQHSQYVGQIENDLQVQRDTHLAQELSNTHKAELQVIIMV